MQFLDKRFVGIVRFKIERFKIEDNFGNILFNALDGRELVIDAFYHNAYDRGAGKVGQKHSPKRVTERVSVTAIERLHDKLACAVTVGFLHCDSRHFDFHHG